MTEDRSNPRSLDGRLTIILAALVLFAGALVTRAAQVQIGQHERWANAGPLPAPRGAILDASGVPLAESRELVKLAVAPHELRETRAFARRLTAAGVDPQWVSRATDTTRKWVEIPGQFLPSEVASIATTRGVHARPVVERVYVTSEGVRRLVGRARPDGGAVDGIELALDSLLRGEQGRGAVMRDAKGRRFDSPAAMRDAPRSGHSIILTLNRELQDIAERALHEAAEQTGADGGDIVVLDPKSGSVLAMASKRADTRSTASTALTEPYEPGSTIKPFVVAALLEHGRARPDESVDTRDGRLTIEGRTVTDVHKAGVTTLTGVLQHSSNVGMALFASRLTPGEQYQALRDAGFGAPTGMPYPSEASGTLREPARWSRQSQVSLAIGYEIAVTPLQLAMAYGALANGGELLEPAIVKEVRDPEGEVVYRHERRVVRRIMSAQVAATVRKMLVGVVSDGTGGGAHLASYEVGGKSGTARRVSSAGGYASGMYTASFVGMFPADDPQYVILVKLDNPSGAYYGGRTAAPLSKVVLEAAIASRNASLDRRALAGSRRDRVPVSTTSIASTPDTVVADTPVARPFVADLAVNATGATAASPSSREIPPVDGMSVREAVKLLHDAGFRVKLEQGDRPQVMPAPGSIVEAGSLVRLTFPK
jgi:cell division protein FtsI (penicillin-binding protein 3)